LSERYKDAKNDLRILLQTEFIAVYRVYLVVGLWYREENTGLKVQGLRFEVQGSRFKVRGSAMSLAKPTAGLIGKETAQNQGSFD